MSWHYAEVVPIADLLAMPGLSAGTLCVLVLAALLAGWVDAVVGGGGLVQLPALLLAPRLAPAQALGTNKLSSVMGTSVATATYQRQVGIPRAALPTAGLAFLAAILGAVTATHLPTEIFTPIIIVALVAVLVLTVARPSAFSKPSSSEPLERRSLVLRAGAIGGVIGFYDGLLGPGTGSFLLIGFLLLLGFETLKATAAAKTVNLATNAGALLLFSLAGVVQWRPGLALGCASMPGGWLGARTASRLGARFIRVVLIMVVLALLAKLTAQQFA